MKPAAGSSLPCSIAPWLSVRSGQRALAFYQAAFGAVVTHQMEPPDGSLIARLSVEGAEFWISGDAVGEAHPSAEPVGGGSVRMILTVPDPDAMFARALAAGAKEVFPVGEGHGWRLGRVVDPFGLHWEIGRPLS